MNWMSYHPQLVHYRATGLSSFWHRWERERPTALKTLSYLTTLLYGRPPPESTIQILYVTSQL